MYARALPRSAYTCIQHSRPWNSRAESPTCSGTGSADIQREQKRAEKLIKDAAKRNDTVSAKVGLGCTFSLPLYLPHASRHLELPHSGSLLLADHRTGGGAHAADHREAGHE